MRYFFTHSRNGENENKKKTVRILCTKKLRDSVFNVHRFDARVHVFTVLIVAAVDVVLVLALVWRCLFVSS